MKQFLRPTLLLVVAAVLAGVGAVVWWRLPPGEFLPQPVELAEGEEEVAWLSPATSASAWERFVAAVRRTERRLLPSMPDLEARLEGAYPPRSIDVPEVSLVWKGGGRRLTFRWYKLTSRSKTSEWVTALLRRQRPPLAFLGGNSSESALILARHLANPVTHLAQNERPALLLTTATAQFVPSRDDPAGLSAHATRDKLLDLYPGRTFRYCFNNAQMARGVIRFAWNHADLQPDIDPVYLVQWNDDAYSYDLTDRFLEAIHHRAPLGCAAQWAWASGCLLQGGPPPGLAGGLFPVFPICRVLGDLPRSFEVPTSVGSFSLANRYETEEAGHLSQAMLQQPYQHRPLLCVTGQAQPSRRFLKALHRLDPDHTRKLVVAMGDAISFNTIYRDRRVAWPIQDLPMALVFFCHDNPIDHEAGFRPAPESIVQTIGEANHADDGSSPDDVPSSTGTEDVLLNADIVETLALAFAAPGPPCTTPNVLIERLHEIRSTPAGLSLGGTEGRPFFRSKAEPNGDTNGDRMPGTGEHIICLRPVFDGNRVLPQASIEVWRWQPSDIPTWKLVGPPLSVSYVPPTVEGGVHR